MRALRYYNPGDLRLEHDIPEPVCADYQVKIKPAFVGVLLVEPLATAWRAVVESDIKPGANVLILGAGPIGLGVIQCCKAKGATTIVVAEVADERQAMAKSFGATHVFNPLDVDLVAAVKAASPDGQGSIASYDCAGLQSTLQAACLATRPRGMVINVAIWEKEVLFNPNLLIFGERKFHSVLGYSQDDFRNVITAMKDGLLKPDAMITRKITIDRVVEDGFEALIKDKKKHIKIQVDLSVA